MEKLCDDILREILIRLWAKNIGQLRRVCKRWNTLSREAKFIKSHLHRSTSNNEILLVDNRGSGIPIKACSSASPHIKLNNFIKFPGNFPSDMQIQDITIIGAANGLICFYVGYYNAHVIHIWNPSLSALLTVPPYTIPVPFRKYCFFLQFGFDPKNDDYKIVKLVRPKKQYEEWLQVEVYSMRSGCWKLIGQSPPSGVARFYNHGDINVCADGHDGHLHWLCCYDHYIKTQNILAFDLAAESFSKISLPDLINFDYYHSLGVLGGKLCVITSSLNDRYCEVWVMDKYGSWAKNGLSHFHKSDLYQFGFTIKNNFIYKDCNQVIHLHDPAVPFNKVKPFQKIKLKPLGFNVIIPYVDSLVWVTPAPL